MCSQLFQLIQILLFFKIILFRGGDKLKSNEFVVAESKAFDLPEPREEGILQKSNNEFRKFCVSCQENPRITRKFTSLQSMEY